MRLSADAAVVPTPCPVGDVVTMRRALTHPTLATPVAHVGATETAPLLDCLDHTASLADLLRAWSAHLPAHQAEATARWLFEVGARRCRRPVETPFPIKWRWPGGRAAK